MGCDLALVHGSKGREGPQVFKHLSVKMLQGSKGGSHSC